MNPPTLISLKYVDTLLLTSCCHSMAVMSDTLQPHELQCTRFPCPSPSPGVCSNLCPLNWWCHPTISFSVFPFSSCLQSFPASGSFLMSWLSLHQVAEGLGLWMSPAFSNCLLHFTCLWKCIFTNSEISWSFKTLHPAKNPCVWAPVDANDPPQPPAC